MTSTTPNHLRDPNTLSNYHEFITIHTIANFSIDFGKKNLVGNVLLKLKAVNKACQEVVLDTSYLDIQDVRIDSHALKWDLLPRSEPLGSALKIRLDKAVRETEFVEIDIKLQTTEKCTALQWLTSAQTSNKRHPFICGRTPPFDKVPELILIVSQCEAIHARSVFPCQDTPDIKSTYELNLRSPLPVIASGLSAGTTDFQPGKAGAPGSLLYTFKQDIPIPSYLFAIASGDIATASIGPRSIVAASPDEIQASKWELEADTERFIQAAEELIYPYAWTTYNVLILPPSFPYGGMENPVFSFATPTIISGDRENVGVIAHELAHSWSGNLVSNASWEHFWLNEGWTVYLERRILAVIHGEPYRDFSAIIGWKALSDSVAHFGEMHEFTKLVINLEGKDPSDAFSSVPYEKGFTFLYHLEKIIGKEKWDKFIPHYFKTFARKSLDSYEFKASAIDFFSSDPDANSALQSLDWNAWFNAPGLPPKPDFDTSLVNICYALAAKWESRSSSIHSSIEAAEHFEPKASDLNGWTANQIVVFLERVQEFRSPLTKSDTRTMSTEYGFLASKNVEILSRFLAIGLRARDEDFYGPTAELLGKVGRMKFVRPLYCELIVVDRKFAEKIFAKNRDFYHPICRAMIEKDLFDGKQ